MRALILLVADRRIPGAMRSIAGHHGKQEEWARIVENVSARNP